MSGIHREGGLNRAVTNDQCIGRLEALVRGREAEIAFVFVPDSWRQGYATEATAALIMKLEEDGIERVWACVTPRNDRSLALCRRLMFHNDKPPAGLNLATYDYGDDVISLYF